MICVRDAGTAFEREPLVKPFGFKGGYLTKLWQTAALLTSEAGESTVGLGTQSVLWSDPDVFARHSEDGGNALMFAVLDHAAGLSTERAFESPLDLLEELLPQVFDYARRITERPDLRKTFALNALVALDNAAWMLYARERGAASFDEMIPASYRPALSHRHDRVACIPVAGYGASRADLVSLAEAGHFLIKVKLGHPGDPGDMLERDAQRVADVHEALGGLETPHTASRRIPYYFDVNGRYENVEQLKRLLDHAERVGALDRILLIEEPFPEAYETDVSGIGVRLAADESAHTDADARRRMDMGYGAIALKPVAKTTSMTLKIAAEAHRRGVPCFCADLTVNPILVDWNKCFAARLAPFPGLEVGLLETNGHQNYRRWHDMARRHPRHRASWTRTTDGLFHLGNDFYEESGGILDVPRHYAELVR